MRLSGESAADLTLAIDKSMGILSRSPQALGGRYSQKVILLIPGYEAALGSYFFGRNSPVGGAQKFEGRATFARGYGLRQSKNCNRHGMQRLIGAPVKGCGSIIILNF